MKVSQEKLKEAIDSMRGVTAMAHFVQAGISLEAGQELFEHPNGLVYPHREMSFGHNLLRILSRKPKPYSVGYAGVDHVSGDSFMPVPVWVVRKHG